MGRGAGWVGALKALRVGGLRQMSVPGGVARVKGGVVVVVVLWEALVVFVAVVVVGEVMDRK